jgi:hypothetical protein
MSTELIDRYVYAVTRELPENQRADIDRELHSLIEDMLDEHHSGADLAASDIEAVLLELGNPRELADKYRGYPQYLIGPELYPTYLTVLKAVAMAIGIAFVVLLFLGLIQQPMNAVESITNTLTSFFGAVFQGLAWVTFIFALVEFNTNKTHRNKLKEANTWNLKDLPEVPDKKTRISRGETITGIIFTVLFAAVFLFSPELWGVWVKSSAADGMTIIPFFNLDVIQGYMPYIIGLFMFGLIIELLKLVSGKWTRQLLAADILNSLLQLGGWLYIFRDTRIWNIEFYSELQRVFNASDALNNLTGYWASASTTIVFAVIFLIFAIQIMVSAVRWLRLSREG